MTKEQLEEFMYEHGICNPDLNEEVMGSLVLDIVNDIIEDYDRILQSRWIPVSERLPEQYKEVIVTDIETTDTYLSQYIGNGHWECDNGLFDNRIIAWMPLPKPYEPQESEG